MTLAIRLRTRLKAASDAPETQYAIDRIVETATRPLMATVIKATENLDDRRILITKGDDGVARWFSRASTAFEDKDQEIVSKAALQDAADVIMTSGGIPLIDQPRFRWWHTGTKSAEPSIDFGVCDLAFVCGETLYAGGYFFNDAFATLLKADDEISIGFLPLSNPLDNNGVVVYDSISLLEISVCPAGTARNYFTGVARA